MSPRIWRYRDWIKVDRRDAEVLIGYLRGASFPPAEVEAVRKRMIEAATKLVPPTAPSTQEPPRWCLSEGSRIHIAREWDLRQMSNPSSVIMRCGTRPDVRWSRTLAEATCHRCLSWETHK